MVNRRLFARDFTQFVLESRLLGARLCTELAVFCESTCWCMPTLLSVSASTVYIVSAVEVRERAEYCRQALIGETALMCIHELTHTHTL